MATSIIIFVLLVIVLLCLLYIMYLIYFKKYTRERFAFMAVTVMVGLFSTLILQVYSSQGYVTAIINTSNFFFKTSISNYSTDIKDHLLTLIGLVLLMRFIFNLHKNWDGPISETLYNKLRFHENPTMLAEALIQLKDFLSKEKNIVPHIEGSKNKNYNIFTEYETDKMPWYENVYELLSFSDSQYKIDLIKDYYSAEKTFISKYGQTNQNIAILCTIDYPNDITIRNFVLFAKSQKLDFTKYIIAIKNYEGEIENIKKFDTDIAVRNEDEMLNSLIDFSSYSQFIKDLFTTKEITVGSNITIKDIYVHLNAKNDNNEQIGEIESYVTKWLNSNHDNKHLALLGEYGCGKSVLSLKITHELLQSKDKNTRIPILIELRGKSPRNLNVTEILSTWASNYRLDAASLLKLHKAGKLLIIFEGFDEMDMIGDREMRLNHFQRLWEFAIPKSKVIITGRPNFFLDDKELKMNLGIDKPFETSHYCEAIHLEKFNNEQIKLALRNIDKNTREQVIEILEKSTNSNFYDLISRPAILYLVAVIWKERKLSELKDKINSAIVISEFIKYSYSRQSTKNIQFPLTEKEREYFMLGIAVGMFWQTEFSNQLNKNDLENIILKLYKNFPSEITATENAIQPKRKTLKERMIDNNQAEETVLTDVRSCGILVNDLTRKDYFKFAHKSFLEYQASLYFVESVLQDKGDYNIMMNAITSSLDITVSGFKHSQETISFTSEILISKLDLTKSDDPHKVCRRLFSILYPNKLLGKHPFLAALFDMYLPTKLFTYSFLVTTFLFTYKFILGKQEDFFKMPFLVSIFMALSMIMLFSTFYSRLKFRHTGRRTLIWLQCCEQLNISEKEIEKVVPKKYISYLSGEKSKDPFQMLMRRMLLPLLKEKETK